MALEVEIKLPVSNLADIRRRITLLGFRIHTRRGLESNTLFDTHGLRLRRRGELVRIRTFGSRSVLTYKGPGQAGRHKSREEIEVSLSDAASASEVMLRLGYREVFRYQKYRTEYKQPPVNGTITVDETPIGNFLELEGAAHWIDRTAALLGFSKTDYITESYGRLYSNYRRSNRLAPKDMVFKNPDLE